MKETLPSLSYLTTLWGGLREGREESRGRTLMDQGPIEQIRKPQHRQEE